MNPVIGMKVEYGSQPNATVWKIEGDIVWLRYGKYANQMTIQEWKNHIETTFIIIKN